LKLTVKRLDIGGHRESMVVVIVPIIMALIAVAIGDPSKKKK